ncbi:MAG: hypothetical protein U0931_33200 [Vulcanimicrobiota bacterium]
MARRNRNRKNRPAPRETVAKRVPNLGPAPSADLLTRVLAKMQCASAALAPVSTYADGARDVVDQANDHIRVSIDEGFDTVENVIRNAFDRLIDDLRARWFDHYERWIEARDHLETVARRLCPAARNASIEADQQLLQARLLLTNPGAPIHEPPTLLRR